tara:strand:- start:3 stop:932 length:930 start_codon:yes stop_codon:yes gene_type:complete
MRKFIPIVVFAFIFSSCEVIEGPYMSDSVNPIDTTTNNYVKNILIEDFTGHLCKNCPDAASELEAIQSVYGSQIIGLAIHSGTTFARSYPIDPVSNPDDKFIYDFRTMWGEELDAFFEVSENGLPKGMINRSDYNSSGDHRKDFGQWSSIVADELDKEVKFGIDIEVIQNSNMLSDQFDIIINSEAVSNVQNNHKLVVCITENNITNWQKDGDIDNPTYTHKHVLRSFLTPTWGDDLSSEEINIGDSFSNAYTIVISDLEDFNIEHSENILTLGNGNSGGWDLSNLYVLAYIYDISNYEILQVEEKSLF